MVDGWSSDAQALVLPWRCLFCGVPSPRGFELCPGCRDALPWIEHACPRCGTPLATASAAPCPACQRHPPRFDRVLAPLRYAFPVDRAIGALKFHGRLEHGRLLGALLAGWLGSRAPELAGAALLPMPLHRSRLATRGFNQAAEIARWVAVGRGLRIEPQLAHRIRATPEQSRLDAAARRRNLADAFAVLRRPPPRVVVLDDVVTTGATAGALAATLRGAGADEVVVLAVARAAR